MKFPTLLLLFCTLFLAPFATFAQAQEQAQEPALKIGPLACRSPQAEPGSVWRTEACKIGDDVRAQVTGFTDWRPNDPNRRAKLVLSVNGRKLTGSTPGYFSLAQMPAASSDQTGSQTGQAGAETYLLFSLGQTGENRADWQRILKRKTPVTDIKVVLEVVEKDSDVTFGGSEVQLKIVSNFRLAVLILIYAVVFGTLVWGAQRGFFLREVGPKAKPDTKNPFSLASTQMALWFVIILGSFIYLWMVTGDIDTLTAGVLGLAGISVATGLTATAITASTQSTRAALVSERANLAEKLEILSTEIGSLSLSAAPELHKEKETVKQRFDEVADALAKLPEAPKAMERSNFFTDLLRSQGEVTFSRLQIVAWTVVLAIIFLHSVFTTLAMPEFSGTLLGLMGISGGTYVGFKFPKSPNIT